MRLFGRISSGEDDGNFWEEKRDLKKWGWGRISSYKGLYTTPVLLTINNQKSSKFVINRFLSEITPPDVENEYVM